ncbi:MAG: hypothetical protein KDM63_13465 [Verrucomicrobiae bacterium]|nr:hypothetical protein [Verrucomicrobiae bacterium]
MEFDSLQQLWQQQEKSSRVSVDREVLLRLVRREQASLRATLWRRDLLEIAVALVLVPVWIWLGRSREMVWTWYLAILGLLWIAGFLLVERWRQRRNGSHPGIPLKESVEHALAQVEHQITLLRNVAWWYLLPLAIPLLIFHVHHAWAYREPWDGASQVIFGILVVWGIYELNQHAVRKNLSPRRDELREFLASLEETPTTEASQDDT